MTPSKSREPNSTVRSSRNSKSVRARRAAQPYEGGAVSRQVSSSAGGHPRNMQRPSAGSAPSYGSAASARYENSIRQSTAVSDRAGALAASQYSRNNPVYSLKGQGITSKKPLIISIVVALMVVLIGCGTAFGLYMSSVNKALTQGGKSEEELMAIDDVLSGAPTSLTEPFYMLLIGSDKRVYDDSMGARSDTNIVVRVDPEANQLTMISIPRDTRVYLDDYGGYTKFNAAYSYGGTAGTIKAAENLLGIEISHYAEIDFDGLIDLVDVVGGVDVEVEERIDDTDADDTTDSGGERIIIEEGPQHLDGKAALVFARSRAYADGDFTRTSNQRKLIKALGEKIINLPITEMPGAISKAAGCTNTDLSVSDIIGLAQKLKESGELTIYSAMLPSTTDMIEEGGMMISYVINDEAGTRAMMELVEQGKDPNELTASVSEPAADSGTSGGYYYEDTSTYQDPGYYDPGYQDPGYYDPGYQDQGYQDPGYQEQTY